MNLARTESGTKVTDRLIDLTANGKREALTEDAFNRTIAIERKRTERSKQPFLLMVLETGLQSNQFENGSNLECVASALMSSIRETDVIGWYNNRAAIGVIYTALVVDDKNSLLSMIMERVTAALRESLTEDQIGQITISFNFFPDDWDSQGPGRPSNPALYPDLLNPREDKRSLVAVKRAMDIAGSAVMLALCSPAFLVIALAVKITSKGPVFFRQQRVGQYGQQFTFFKFRSMYTNNDHNVHKEYITKFIASQASKQPATGDGEGVFKLTNDKRVTRVGRFLRRTSMDELPQFLNVLRGEMSLVGPRPPIPYELAAYQIWHRRRVLEVKPGITGLWQVTGRSRVGFDEMVRLDLRYATSWSPTLDLTILMRTPFAVIKGEGAH